MKLSDNEKLTLTHTLTGSQGRGAYRNYYAAGKHHHNAETLAALVDKGMMKKGAKYEDGYYYHATVAGAEAVGLDFPE